MTIGQLFLSAQREDQNYEHLHLALIIVTLLLFGQQITENVLFNWRF